MLQFYVPEAVGCGWDWTGKEIIDQRRHNQEYSHLFRISSYFGCISDVISLYDSVYGPETVGCGKGIIVRGNN